jgi:hypothetical protein
MLTDDLRRTISEIEAEPRKEENGKVILDERHFKLFKVFCCKWQKTLGLNHWNIVYSFDKTDSGVFACCRFNQESMKAVIVLEQEWDVDLKIELNTLQQLEGSAFHEMCELLLAPLTLIANARDNEVVHETHCIINRLDSFRTNSSLWEPTVMYTKNSAFPPSDNPHKESSGGTNGKAN